MKKLQISFLVILLLLNLKLHLVLASDMHVIVQSSGGGTITGYETVTVVNTSQADDQTGTILTSIDSDPFVQSAGNCNVVYFSWYNNSIPPTTSTLTDMAGNSYSSVDSTIIDNATRLTSYVTWNTSSHATNVIHAVFASAQYPLMTVVQMSGCKRDGNPSDGHDGKTVAFAASITSNSFSTIQSNEMLTMGGRMAPGTITPGSGYSITKTNNSGYQVVQNKLVASTQTNVTATLTNSVSSSWLSGVVTIKAAAITSTSTSSGIHLNSKSFLYNSGGFNAPSIVTTIGSRTRYNDQFNGSNSWPNNGRSIDDDSGRSTWCLDNKTYVIMNDGNGPNNSLVNGRNFFLVSLSDNYTGPAGGQLYTLVNSMDGYGTITQINSGGWTDGKHWKTDGIHCEGGRMIISIYRQGGSSFITGSFIWSDDFGVTWCNAFHTDSNGDCTITPLANGDPPSDGQQQFNFTGPNRGFEFVQYGKDNVSATVIEKNDIYTYMYLQGDNDPNKYVVRMTHANLHKVKDNGYMEFYKGAGSCVADSSWSTNQADKVSLVGLSNLTSNAMYIPETGYYMIEAIVPNQDAVFYSSRSACGPFIETARIVYGGDPAVLEAWFSPVIKSISTSSTATETTTTTLWILGWGSGGRTGNEATNNYSQHNRVITTVSPIH